MEIFKTINVQRAIVHGTSKTSSLKIYLDGHLNLKCSLERARSIMKNLEELKSYN